MKIASWNLNHRVGMTRFRPEAVDAAIALGADALCFNEYYPQRHAAAFEARLAESGWRFQLITEEPNEIANRTFVASRIPVVRNSAVPPFFDQ